MITRNEIAKREFQKNYQDLNEKQKDWVNQEWGALFYEEQYFIS